MPYLHWDTDRNRSRMGEVIDTMADQHEEKMRLKARDEKMKRQTDRATRMAEKPPCLPRIIHKRGAHHRMPRQTQDAEQNAKHRNIEDVAWQWHKRKWDQQDKSPDTQDNGAAHVVESDTARSRMARAIANLRGEAQTGRKLQNGYLGSRTIPLPRIDDHRRLRPVHPLAQLLVDAARVYEEMMAFRDRRVHEKFLFPEEGSHMHPRRSLDQAYFWKLKSTRRRDRDQVVYRHTSPKFLHEFKVPWKEKDGHHIVESFQDREARPNDKDCDRCLANAKRMTGSEWTGHERFEDHDGDEYGLPCQHCTEQIRKISRAIMVDQLWMWILDENTILTCFPRRYGVGATEDPSGVHDTIRARLKNDSNPSNRIMSVYDLGLIILEECFDTLFDRTTTPDNRPQVLDIFAESIGRVVGYHRCFHHYEADWSRQISKPSA